jgi:hypothetical protein
MYGLPCWLLCHQYRKCSLHYMSSGKILGCVRWQFMHQLPKRLYLSGGCSVVLPILPNSIPHWPSYKTTFASTYASANTFTHSTAHQQANHPTHFAAYGFLPQRNLLFRRILFGLRSWYNMYIHHFYLYLFLSVCGRLLCCWHTYTHMYICFYVITNSF